MVNLLCYVMSYVALLSEVSNIWRLVNSISFQEILHSFLLYVLHEPFELSSSPSEPRFGGSDQAYNTERHRVWLLVYIHIYSYSPIVPLVAIASYRK
jgi:hypothetical protein